MTTLGLLPTPSFAYFLHRALGQKERRQLLAASATGPTAAATEPLRLRCLVAHPEMRYPPDLMPSGVG